MAEGDVVVVGTGMMTAIGLSTQETAASVRARTMRFGETSMHDKRFEPFVLAEVIEDGLPELAEIPDGEPRLTSREMRMLRLAAMPLLECLEPLPGGVRPLGIDLALPENETTLPLDGARFLAGLSRQTEGAFDREQSDASLRGRAAGLLAIGKACARIRERKTQFAIAGGVDSYRDLYVLGTLDRDQRVKSEANLDGFIPGEGAGFVLLCDRRTAERAKLPVLATLSPVAEGAEKGHLGSEQPYRGDGLAEVFAQLFGSTPRVAPVREVWSSMNGENFWAKEWGVGFLRQRERFDPGHTMNHPADCFGDLGAACGPVMVGLAASGIGEDYRHGPSLVYASSDGPARAALLLTSSTEG